MGNAVMDNENNCCVIQKFIHPQVNELGIKDFWFQKHSALAGLLNIFTNTKIA